MKIGLPGTGMVGDAIGRPQVYHVVWEFLAAPGREAEFERAYGPDGDWARLFSRDPGWLGTDLLHDRGNPRRFLTIDRWTSEQAYQAFTRQHQAEYGQIDERMAPLCAAETRVGVFSVSAPSPPS
jgi:heme-degrading monooxygenase HmoA